MTKATVDQDRRLLYVLVFGDMNLDQADFATATRTAASQVSVYLHGGRTVPDAVLDRALGVRRFPRALVRPALRAIRSFRAAAKGWSRVDRVMAETFFAELLAVGGEALEAIFTAAAPALPQPAPAAVPSAADRALAPQLWRRLEARNARQRLALVEGIEDFHSWALCEAIAAKSRQAAPDSPAEALELAELSLRVAELCTGAEPLRLRARGYAGFHVADARRVADDLPGSAAALAAASSLWEAGASGDPGLFDEAVVLRLQDALI